MACRPVDVGREIVLASTEAGISHIMQSRASRYKEFRMIDLNRPFTAQDVANLIAAKDDSRDRQIRVTKAGLVYLSDEVGHVDIDGLAFQLDIFNSGNDYTGIKASHDAKWVARLEKALRDNWPNPKSFVVDIY